jgi:thymidylate kinase
MIILVEGPDGAGKTTLTEKLCKSYPKVLVYHFGAPVPDEDQFTRYATPIIDYGNTEVLIYDRSWYSEFVYGPIMRGQSELNYAHSQALEALVLQHGGGHVIYCTGKPSTLWLRCKKRGETYIQNAEQHAELCKQYDYVMANVCRLPVVTLDVTGKHYIDICKM